MINLLTKTLFIWVLLQTSLLSNDINIDTQIIQAQKSNKEVILYLHRIGCSYCNSMQEFTLEDDNVAQYLSENYEVIHINVSLKEKITYKNKQSGGICLAKKIGYDFYPSVLFLDSNADIKYASVGYKDETEFMVILAFVKSSSYKTMSLNEYKNKIGFKKNLDIEIVDPRKHAR